MLFLQTQAYKTPGGMQTYMRRIGEIMSMVCNELKEPLVSVSVMDSMYDNSLHANPIRYDRFIGARGSKARFLLATSKLLLRRRQRVAVLGHIGLATTGYLLKSAGMIDRYILILHGIEAWRQLPRHLRKACRQSAAIVATTRYTACQFQVQNLFAHSRMYVIPLAFGEHTLPCYRPRFCAEQMEVLTVGRLDARERYKGLECVMEAVGKLAKSGIPIRLRIAGDGSDLERLKNYADSVAPKGTIQMLGQVTETELTDLYRTSDIFAMPSKNEGFGLVFLEAMRFGNVCIGGRHGGTPEVIRDGVDGFLIDYGDRAMLTDILVYLYSHPQVAEQIGRKAHERAASEYTFPVMRSRWESVLRGVYNN